MMHYLRFVAVLATLLAGELGTPEWARGQNESREPKWECTRLRGLRLTAFVNREWVKAYSYDQQAAETGVQACVSSMTNLGGEYARGEVLPRDFVLSYMWLNLAVSRGDEETREFAFRAREFLVRGHSMTTQQIAEAQRLTREWDAAHPRAP